MLFFVQKWDITGIPDLTGKVAIVTGAKLVNFHVVLIVSAANRPHSATSGIGFHVAQQLAIKGAKVYVGARNSEKAHDAIIEMIKAAPLIKHDHLVPLAMNLEDLKQVQSTAWELVAKAGRLDILVNKAGL